MKNRSILQMVSFILLLSGCSAYGLVAPAPPEPSPTPIAVSTLAPPTATLEPTVTATVPESQPTATETSPPLTATPTETALPAPTFTPEPDWLAFSGRTEDGLMFLGNPEAPIKMIDFSDFM